MTKSLRYASVDALPPGLREQARKQLESIPKPHPPITHPGHLAAAARLDVVDSPVDNSGVIPRAHKYGAQAVVVDGIRFDSKREARYYVALKARVAAGEVAYFLRQVPLHLPGGTKLVIDFLEVHADGSLHYVDAKGHETEAFRIKRREVEHHYPIRLELV